MQSLRRELEKIKSASQPTTPCTPSVCGTPHSEPGEHGLTPILEETSTPIKEEVAIVSVTAVATASYPPSMPSKKEPTVTVAEVSPLTTPTQNSYNASNTTQDLMDDPQPTLEDLARLLGDLAKRAKVQISRLSFWQVATSVYLTVLVARLLVSDRHREALYSLIFP